jgi:predicted transcriptional regulator
MMTAGESGKEGDEAIRNSVPDPIRCYLVAGAWILFIGFCLVELVYIPLFGVHTYGVPIPRWQMRPDDLVLHMVHSVSPILVQPVQAIFFWCVGFGLYFGFRTLSKKTVLGEPTRSRIFNAVKKEPGIHFNALRRQTGINRGTLRYHLTILTRTKKITSYRDGIFSRYLPEEFGMSECDTIVSCRFRSGPDHAVLTYLIHHSDATQQEIGRAMGLSPSVVSWRVQRLWHEGIVSIDRQGRTVHVTLTNEAEASLQRIRNSGSSPTLSGTGSPGIIGQKN